jgi:hypothetical protein
MNIGYYTSAKLCGKLYDNVYMLKLYRFYVQDNQQEYNNIKYYKDYFNISIKDFIYKDIHSNTDISFATTYFKLTNFSSTPLFLNTTSATDVSPINYVSSDFLTLFIDTNLNPYKSLVTDVSINTYNDRTISYSLYNNIYSYNKLTLDFKNVNTYKFALYDTSTNNNTQLYINNNSSNSSNTINTFMIKTNNFEILNTIKANSKIIFHKNNIFLKNVKTIDICSNFYINNPNYSMRVMHRDQTQTLNSQPFNSTQKYLVGSYDLEIFTLPRTYQRIEVTQSKTTNVDVIPSGCFSYTASKGIVGQIFVDKGTNSFDWVCNLESGLKEGKWYIQPGTYKIVYREKDQKSTAYTKEKSFKIESNRTLNLNL